MEPFFLLLSRNFFTKFDYSNRLGLHHKNFQLLKNTKSRRNNLESKLWIFVFNNYLEGGGSVLCRLTKEFSKNSFS